MSEPSKFQKALAEHRAKAAKPEVPPWGSGPVPGLEDVVGGEATGISAPMERVNELWDADDIITKYDRVIGGKRQDPGKRTESIKAQCPNPAHPDEHPSAWFNTEKQVITCGTCGFEGWNGAGLVALAYGIPNTPANFPLIKREYAKRVHGYDYEAEVAKASTQPPPLTVVAPLVTQATRWERVDLSDMARQLRDGTLKRPTPTVGMIENAGALFYKGKVNGVAGDSNAGKTFTALLACLQEIDKGNTALYIDYEEGALGTVSRLIDMGATDEQLAQFVYVNPDDSFDAAWVAEVLDECNPAIVVIDSTGMSLALDGHKPNDDDDVARWFVHIPLFIAARGPSVVILDHVTKEANGSGFWPIGSQRKRAAITGAQYIQQVVTPFSRARDGHAVLTCAKDRHGTYEQGRIVARLEVKDAAAIVRLVVDTPPVSAMSANEMLVHGFIKDNPGCLQKDIESGTGLNRRTINKCVNELKTKGAISTLQNGSAIHHYTSDHPDVTVIGLEDGT